MEFLRFASSIPGSYFGCCAFDVIQCFNVNPDSPASIELVNGDSGDPINGKYLGTTHKEVFLGRLAIGTFNERNMPNHGFLAVITDRQIATTNGKAWLTILKEQGFEFIRCVDNSVYTGQKLVGESEYSVSPRRNYLFGLFRNVGVGCVEDQFTPPEEWRELPSVVPEAWEAIPDRQEWTGSVQDAQMPLYKALGKPKLYSEDELDEMGVPVTLAGRRSSKPQRLRKQKETATSSPAPFSAPLPDPALLSVTE